MTLTKKGKYWYGDDHSDLRSELTRHSRNNEYEIDDFVDIKCICGGDQFRLHSDEDAGVAIRICINCGNEHKMGDSADYLEDAEIGQHDCMCEKDVFQITVGINRYRNDDESISDDVRWLYIGCRCIDCGMLGCYADWKNEYNGYLELLRNM